MWRSEYWEPALEKFAEGTGLAVKLFDVDGQVVRESSDLPLAALFRESGFDPGLFTGCARRCLRQTGARRVVVEEFHGLVVVGTSLVLDGAIVGAAVAGYAFSTFPQVPAIRRWADASGVPFARLWAIARIKQPMPERRLILHGELLRILGDALLREHQRTLQLEDAVVHLQVASTAKDNFLAVVSHELRTPLAAILGWASVLKTTAPQELQHGVEAIERNALIESHMIEDLLDVNRLSRDALELEFQTEDLPRLVHAALETIAGEVAIKTLRLDVIGAGEPLLVKGDARRLQQVFRNILSNAVKFTPEGGRIRVTFAREGDDARVVIADTGKGISPEFLPSAFDMFGQEEHGRHRSREGLGIGLALVKQLVELHNGRVSIASAGPGRGTEVSVRLPLATKRSASALAGLSALVVEGADDTRESLRILLEHLGAAVSVAREGREALDMMVQGAHPDFVLCNLRMPTMDGFEFMRELALERSTAHPPVIALSGASTEASRERTRQAGFEGHIEKPFGEAAILAEVGAALAHRQGGPARTSPVAPS